MHFPYAESAGNEILKGNGASSFFIVQPCPTPLNLNIFENAFCVRANAQRSKLSILAKLKKSSILFHLFLSTMPVRHSIFLFEMRNSDSIKGNLSLIRKV